jgi:hypothetical protein
MHLFAAVAAVSETRISELAASLQNELAILEFIHCLVETLDR